MLRFISKWFVFLSSSGKHKGSFSNISCGNLDELLEVKLTIFCCPPPPARLDSPGVFTLRLEPIALVNYSSGFPIPAVAPLTVSSMSLCS